MLKGGVHHGCHYAGAGKNCRGGRACAVMVLERIPADIRASGSVFRMSDPNKGVGPVPTTFIRAPYIESVSGDTEALAVADGHIVAVRQGNQLATAFHPELSDDLSVHRYFLEIGANGSDQRLSF